MPTPVGDERGRSGRADGHGGSTDPGPVTVEQLIARSGNTTGRRAARRTGEVPIPLGPGESLPAHRGPLPPVPGGHSAPSVPRRDAVPPGDDTSGDGTPGDGTPRRGLPPVPGGSPSPAPVALPPGTPNPGPGHRSQPIPPLPGGSGHSVPAPLPGTAGVRYSAPVPPLPGTPAAGVRWSAPVPPLPGTHTAAARAGLGSDGRPSAVQSPHRSAPVPPIPGLDAPAMSGAGSTRRPALDRRAARRAARSPARRRLIRAGLVLAALVGLVVTYHLGLYVHVDRSIARVAALSPEGPEVIAPRLQEGATTYLVVGTGLPGATGPASVTTLLVHVASGGDRAVLVSVPPTALVDTPGCRTGDGTVREPVSETFAASLLAGGPACTVRVVQQLSGLRVDHYLAVDLGRLPSMVDAIGGVSVCLPTPTTAAASARPLPAGTSELTGAQATEYLTPGEAGSDVTGAAAAERTQQLLSATLRSALTAGTLGNPWELTRLLTRAADAITVDEQTTLGDLRTLAGALGHLEGNAVQRATLPVAQVGYVPAGSDQAHVLLDGTGVRSLFDTVIEDGAVPAELAAPAVDAATVPAAAPAVDPAAATTGAEQPAAGPAAQPLTAAPSAVTLDVLNGTATAGLAATVGDQLRQQGFTLGEVGNERGVVDQTVVRHGPGVLEQARTVAAAVPGAVLQPGDALGDTVQLVLGPGFSGVVPVQVAPPVPAATAPPAADPPAAQTTPAASTEPVSCS